MMYVLRIKGTAGISFIIILTCYGLNTFLAVVFNHHSILPLTAIKRVTK